MKPQAETLQNPQEVGFINHQYRQKFAGLSRDGIYKPSLQGEILKYSQEVNS